VLSRLAFLFDLINYTSPFLLNYCVLVMSVMKDTCDSRVVTLADDEVIVNSLYDLLDRLK
jgi:hypothetical protein